jgi:biotin carboxyl carrier protein
MITVDLLDDLLKRMQAAGLSELEVQQGDTSIIMRLGSAVPAVASSKPVPVRSQSLGTFRASHPRRPNTAFKPGDHVLKGTALGYLEASGTLTVIPAPVAGTLSEILARDGDLIGFGAHVFTLEESAS